MWTFTPWVVTDIPSSSVQFVKKAQIHGQRMDVTLPPMKNCKVMRLWGQGAAHAARHTLSHVHLDYLQLSGTQCDFLDELRADTVSVQDQDEMVRNWRRLW